MKRFTPAATGRSSALTPTACWSNVIEIEHGEYEFFYCGLGENFLVKEGDTVTKGQAIGTVTAVPFEAAEGVHLHLEVRRDGIYVDPESILTGQE